jgi:hypothetical protein
MTREAWTVRIGAVAYEAESMDAIRQWLALGSITSNDEVWDPLERRWRTVQEVLLSSGHPRASAPPALHGDESLPSQVADILLRRDDVHLTDLVIDLLRVAFGYAAAELTHLESPQSELDLISVCVANRLRFLVGARKVDVLAGESSSLVCRIGAEHGGVPVVVTNGVRWLCFERRGGVTYDAVERIDITHLLRQRARPTRARLARSGLLMSRYRRAAMR